MSGVLAVVVLGAILSSEKTSISPEVEKFLHRYVGSIQVLTSTITSAFIL